MAAIDALPGRASRPTGWPPARAWSSPPTRRRRATALEALLVERALRRPSRVVVEEFLDGEELSLLALCDGERALPLAPAQDYKRIFDGDEGPEHGRHGLLLAGARASTPSARARSCAAVHQPVVDELRAPRHAVPRRPLRRADADRRRPAGARVQRPLRRPRDAGGAAAAALATCSSCSSARPRPGRPGGRRRSSGTPRLGGDASCSPARGYPASLVARAT